MIQVGIGIDDSRRRGRRRMREEDDGQVMSDLQVEIRDLDLLDLHLLLLPTHITWIISLF